MSSLHVFILKKGGQFEALCKIFREAFQSLASLFQRILVFAKRKANVCFADVAVLVAVKLPHGLVSTTTTTTNVCCLPR